MIFQCNVVYSLSRIMWLQMHSPVSGENLTLIENLVKESIIMLCSLLLLLLLLCFNKGNNKITELRTILQRESQNP